MKASTVLGATMAIVLTHAVAFAATDPAVKCEGSKLKEVGKYFSCRLKADATAAKKSEPPDYSRCTEKFEDKYTGAESKAGEGVCPSENNVSVVDACVVQAAQQCGALAQGTGGGGSGGSCDTGDCEACSQCAQDGECSDEAQACFDDPDCSALLECLVPCTTLECFDGCAAAHPDGAVLYNAASVCIGDACTDSCGTGGGNGGVCDAGDCNACFECVQEPGGDCADEIDACLANSACVAISQCLAQCEIAGCAQACYDDNPDGQADYDAAIQCVDSSCAGSCG